jgi:hypothetical protein
MLPVIENRVSTGTGKTPGKGGGKLNAKGEMGLNC